LLISPRTSHRTRDIFRSRFFPPLKASLYFLSWSYLFGISGGFPHPQIRGPDSFGYPSRLIRFLRESSPPSAPKKVSREPPSRTRLPFGPRQQRPSIQSPSGAAEYFLREVPFVEVLAMTSPLAVSGALLFLRPFQAADPPLPKDSAAAQFGLSSFDQNFFFPPPKQTTGEIFF